MERRWSRTKARVENFELSSTAVIMQAHVERGDDGIQTLRCWIVLQSPQIEIEVFLFEHGDQSDLLTLSPNHCLKPGNSNSANGSHTKTNLCRR